jgi:excisionase family DNA binding protein
MAMPDPEITPTVSVREAGLLLGLSERSAYRAVGRGEIPVLRVGRRLMVPTARLRQLVGIDEARAS